MALDTPIRTVGLWWFLASTIPALSLAETLVDRIVFVVGDNASTARVITASDLALRAALASRAPSPVSVLRTREADPAAMAIDAAILRSMAGDIQVYQPTDGEVRERLARIRAAFPTPETHQAFLHSHGVDEERLSGLVYTQLVVERFVSRNLERAAQGAQTEDSFDRYVTWIGEFRTTIPVREIPERPPESTQEGLNR